MTPRAHRHYRIQRLKERAVIGLILVLSAAVWAALFYSCWTIMKHPP